LPEDLILAPQPIQAGETVCLYSRQALAECDWTVFGADQQVVARLHFDGGQACFTRTQSLAMGAYLVRINTRDLLGHSTTVLRRLFVVRR
jgi:hypothetical protein